MNTVDYQMPIVVQQRRREESPISGCAFTDFDFTAERPLIVQERKFISVLDNTNTEKSVRSEWRILRKQNSNGIFSENEIIVSPESYFILETHNSFESRNLFHTKTSIFPKVENEKQEEEIEEDFLRGVQPIDHQYKVLFTQEVAIKTSELERWEPTFVFNPNFSDDDE